MLRRASLCIAVFLLLVAGCQKDSNEAEGKDSADASASKKAPEVAPTPTPAPKPAAGGADAAARDDLSCDPSLKGECLEGEQCIGGQGCDAQWSCDAEIVCKKGVREYCGCDGRTFEAAFGNCPTKKYQYPGPCK